MSLVAPRSFPLIERPVLAHSIPSDSERLAVARRLVLIGNARVQLAPPVAQPTRSPNQTDIESRAHIATENTKSPKDIQPKAPEPLSSVARRKLRLANSSVPSYPFGNTPPSLSAAALSPLSTNSSNTSSEPTNDRDLPELAPVGVVDMRFLTRQPPSAQKMANKAPKSTSKSSSAGTPTKRAPPPQEEEITTPPRRTSGRQKRGNGRGVAAKGKSAEKGKKGSTNAAAATTGSQGNEITGTSPPPPASGRRSRAAIGKGKGIAASKGQAKGKGAKGAAGPGSNKRKRGDFEEDEKVQEGKEENPPTPPTKRPRRGAAAVAAALAAAQEAAEDAGSAKDEPSPTDAQDDSERVIKRRMRPNARKTAAARAAAMVAKQKRKSVEDVSVAGTADDNDDDEAADSGKEDDGVLKPEGSQRADSPHEETADQEVPNDDVEVPHPVAESLEGAEQEVEQDQETVDRRTKPARGKGGNTRGGRGKNRRGFANAVGRKVGMFPISTRGTPRGTPKSIPNDEDAASVDMGESTRDVSIDPALQGQEASQPPSRPSKPKRGNSSRRLNAQHAPHSSEKSLDELYRPRNEATPGKELEGTPQTEVMDDVRGTSMDPTTEATRSQSQDEVAMSLNPSDV
ncbi:hypothetical protein FRC17_009767 [Serendipita sp. 399]|nr:hypothetical protein FRC17_009767 [Serendipita sp. 399]